MGKDKNERAAKARLGLTGRSRAHTRIFDDLIKSEAYWALTGQQARVLLFALRKWNRASRFDNTPVPEGFAFSPADVPRVDEKTFYEARARMVEVGFVDAPPALQTLRQQDAVRFVWSKRWQSYRPDEATARKEAKRAERRARKAEADKERLAQTLPDVRARHSMGRKGDGKNPGYATGNTPGYTQVHPCSEREKIQGTPPSDTPVHTGNSPGSLKNLHVPEGQNTEQPTVQSIRQRNMEALRRLLARSNNERRS